MSESTTLPRAVVDQALAALDAVSAGAVSLMTVDAARYAIRSAQAAQQNQAKALSREELTDLIAAGLSDAYHCTRVWSAWSVGTMSQDDFEPVDASDTPAEIADAIIAANSAKAAS